MLVDARSNRASNVIAKKAIPWEETNNNTSGGTTTQQVQNDTDFSVSTDFSVDAVSDSIEIIIEDAQQATVSASKILNRETERLPDVLLSGFRLMDVTVLSDIFTSLACPECLSTHSLQLHDINER